MAQRPTWKGALKISLITIPVRAYPATRPNADVSFHQFHRKCHTLIQLRKWCPHCHIEVPPEDIVKGHETSKGRYVFVEEADIKELRPESTDTLDVTTVMEASAIDARYIERVYYLVPDSKVAASSFAVMRKALEGKAAIGRFAIHGREYLAAVVADADGLLLQTLRTAGEVVERDEASEPAGASTAAKPEEVRLARRVIETLESDVDLAAFKDNYETALRQMLEKKGRGEAVGGHEAAATPKRGQVVNLMDALRRSLDAAQADAARRKPTSRRKAAAPAKKTKVVAHPSARSRRRAS
jgi:DNA end-binding protein Ku